MILVAILMMPCISAIAVCTTPFMIVQAFRAAKTKTGHRVFHMPFTIGANVWNRLWMNRRPVLRMPETIGHAILTVSLMTAQSAFHIAPRTMPVTRKTAFMLLNPNLIYAVRKSMTALIVSPIHSKAVMMPLTTVVPFALHHALMPLKAFENTSRIRESAIAMSSFALVNALTIGAVIVPLLAVHQFLMTFHVFTKKSRMPPSVSVTDFFKKKNAALICCTVDIIRPICSGCNPRASNILMPPSISPVNILNIALKTLTIMSLKRING